MVSELKKKGRLGKRQRRMRVALALFLVLFLVLGLAGGLVFSLFDFRSAGELFDAGQQAFKQANYTDAIALYQKGLKKDPNSATGYDLLGLAYYYLHNKSGTPADLQREIEAFRKAVQLDPGNIDALVHLGLALFYEGQKKEAVPFLKKALELNPNHPDRASLEEIIRQGESAP